MADVTDAGIPDPRDDNKPSADYEKYKAPPSMQTGQGSILDPGKVPGPEGMMNFKMLRK
jgi:hypothetical protein